MDIHKNLEKILIDTVIIDSKDRITSISNSSTDFYINIPDTSVGANTLHLRQFGIPLVMDNVKTSNNSYEIDDVAGTINVGSYSISTLCTWLTNNIANYTFSYENNGRVKITNDLAAIFKWEPLTCNTLLGFTNILYNGASSYTAEILPNLLPTKYVTIHSKFLTRNSSNRTIHTDGRSKILASIPIVAELGSYMLYFPDEPLLIYLKDTNMNQVDFQFRDDSGDILDIDNKNIYIMMERLNT